MIKDYELRIGRQIDIGIRFVLGAGGGEVFYPLARLVSYVTGYKVVPAEGGYKVKEICLVKVLYVPLKNLFRLPRYVGITVRKGRPLAFQKNSARFMVKGAKNLARIGSDFKARFLHTPQSMLSCPTGSPCKVLRTEIDFAFDLDRTDLKLRDLGYGVQGPMGQNIGTGFRIVERHGNNTRRGDL